MPFTNKTNDYFSAFSRKPNRLFGFLFWNTFFGVLPFGLLIAIMSLFGFIPVTINEESRYGLEGALFMLLYIPFFAFLFTFSSWVLLSLGNLFLRLIFGD